MVWKSSINIEKQIKDAEELLKVETDAELKELAEIRLENPYISLRELGDMLSVPLSRSGVNHRLKRICEIANGIG